MDKGKYLRQSLDRLKLFPLSAGAGGRSRPRVRAGGAHIRLVFCVKINEQYRNRNRTEQIQIQTTTKILQDLLPNILGVDSVYVSFKCPSDVQRSQNTKHHTKQTQPTFHTNALFMGNESQLIFKEEREPHPWC
jgi:hypothetical protein